MIASVAKGFAAKSKAHAARAMSTVRYAEYGHPLNVLTYVQLIRKHFTPRLESLWYQLTLRDDTLALNGRTQRRSGR